MQTIYLVLFWYLIHDIKVLKLILLARYCVVRWGVHFVLAWWLTDDILVSPLLRWERRRGASERLIALLLMIDYLFLFQRRSFILP